MIINYQGQVIATTAQTVAEFLAEQKVNVETVVIELNGEIYSGCAGNVQTLMLHAGDVLNIFRIVAGG